MASLGDAWVNIKVQSGELVAGLADAQSKVSKSADAMAAKLAGIGKGMAIAGAVITAAFGLTVKAAMDFNKEVANIATLIPGSTKRVDELKSAIRDMAVTVGKDTADLAQGAYQVISAWGDTADTVGILGIAAKAATAGVATTTDAIDLLSAVTKGYGDTSTEAVQKASDLAFQTVTLGQTTFPELAASIGKVIPLTSELGVSQEELFAVMATGTGVTGKAAEVSTQLRGIMQSLMSPTADMTKLLEEKGYVSGKAMLADLGLAGSLDLIKSAAEASGMPLQKYISSIEGQTLALALTGTQADNYITKLAAMKDSVGLTDIAFKEQTEGVNAAGFAFQQAKIQIGVLTQEIGDKLLPMLVPLIQKVTEIIGKVRDWIEANPELTELIVKWGAGIGALMLVLGSLLLILPGLATLIGALTTPIGLVFAAIGLAIANFIIWYNVIKEIDKILHSHHTTLKDVEAAENILAEAQVKLADKIGITVEELKEFQKVGASVTEMMGRMSEEVKAAAEEIRNSAALQEFYNFALAKLKEEAEKGTISFRVLYEEMGKLKEMLKQGTGAFDDQVQVLQEAQKAYDVLQNFLAPVRETIIELTKELTPYEQKIVDVNAKYDDMIEAIKMFNVTEAEQEMAIKNVNIARDAEIAKIEEDKTATEKLIEAKKRLADMTKSLTDKIYEFMHTEEEVKLRDINREYDLLIENAKEVYTNYNDLRLAIEAINTKRQEEIDKLKEVGKEKDKDIEKNKEVADSIEPIIEKTKEAGEAFEELRKVGENTTIVLIASIKKATIALNNFSKEGVAAAIATVKMSYNILLKNLEESWRKVISHNAYLASEINKRIGEVTKNMNDEIANILYGYGEYLNILKSMGDGAGSKTSKTPSYAVGTPYVPRTGLALLHKGEAVIPANQNTTNNSNTASINIQPGGIVINTPKFGESDAAEMLRLIKRRAAMQGYKFATI